MIATNPIPDVCNYAQCGEKCAPTPEQAAAGLVPLATIPAQRWNSLWNAANQSVNCLKSAAGALIDEINSVLTATGITPDPTCTDQLYQAIDCIRVALGTDQVAGSVKSSSVAGQVSIDTNGFMTANCVGNATQLTTSCKELTGAVNELKTTYDNAFTQVWGNAAWITDCRADVCHSSDALTYGGGTSTLYGHVKLSDTYDSCVGNAASSVAASQLTLYCLMQAVENMSGLSNCAACPISVTQSGAAGTSPQAARSDHVHYLYTDTYFPYTIANQVRRASTQLVDDCNWVPYFYMDFPTVALWKNIGSGWGSCWVPNSYLKGYFRGQPVATLIQNWGNNGCFTDASPGGPTYDYCCWRCLQARVGYTFEAIPAVCSVEFTSSPQYPVCAAPEYDLMGSRYLRYNGNAQSSGMISCPAGTKAMVDGGLHLITSAFQVNIPLPGGGRTCTYCRQFAHSLVELTNDARQMSEGACVYLRAYMPNPAPVYWTGQVCFECRAQAYNCILCAMLYNCGCVGYYGRGYDAYFMYGMTANCVGIGVCNCTLYMRNAQ